MQALLDAGVVLCRHCRIKATISLNSIFPWRLISLACNTITYEHLSEWAFQTQGIWSELGWCAALSTRPNPALQTLTAPTWCEHSCHNSAGHYFFPHFILKEYSTSHLILCTWDLGQTRNSLKCLNKSPTVWTERLSSRFSLFCRTSMSPLWKNHNPVQDLELYFRDLY